MADKKISQLSSATALAGTEAVPVVQSGTTKKATVDQILSPAAGKGVNYSAITPLAGMTSQLLNWYEEGSWTITLGAGSGTITTATATGYYTRVGRIVTINVEVTLTNVGTAAGPLTVSLPFNTGNLVTAVGAGREDGITGVMIQAFAAPSSAICAILTYNNNTPFFNGAVIKFSLTYQA